MLFAGAQRKTDAARQAGPTPQRAPQRSRAVRLQRTIGNQAVLRNALVQRKCASCEEDAHSGASLQRKSADEELDDDDEDEITVARKCDCAQSDERQPGAGDLVAG